jgi:hypothetical protein
MIRICGERSYSADFRTALRFSIRFCRATNAGGKGFPIVVLEEYHSLRP